VRRTPLASHDARRTWLTAGDGRSTPAVAQSPGGEAVRRRATTRTCSVGVLGGSGTQSGRRRKTRRRGARSPAGGF
jgi:hypothetical protein